MLDDLNVVFEPGKITAIVGASGSGKSTIVALLERWYELDNEHYVLPDSAIATDKSEDETEPKEDSDTKENGKIPVDISGSVLVGGHNLDKIDLKWWRSQIGLVQQEPFIFNDTIAKNVEYGLVGSQWENADAKIKRELVEQACKEAFADEYISRLPLVRETLPNALILISFSDKRGVKFILKNIH